MRWLIRKVRRRRCRKHSGGVWAAGHKAPRRGYFRSDPLGVPRDDGKKPKGEISSVQSKEALDPHVMAFAKLEVRLPFFVPDLVFARYSDFRYLVVWV